MHMYCTMNLILFCSYIAIKCVNQMRGFGLRKKISDFPNCLGRLGNVFCTTRMQISHSEKGINRKERRLIVMRLGNWHIKKSVGGAALKVRVYRKIGNSSVRDRLFTTGPYPRRRFLCSSPHPRHPSCQVRHKVIGILAKRGL